jgi:hypothetical protein
LGGHCPDCDAVVLLTDLLEPEVLPVSNTAIARGS